MDNEIFILRYLIGSVGTIGYKTVKCCYCWLEYVVADRKLFTDLTNRQKESIRNRITCQVVCSMSVSLKSKADKYAPIPQSAVVACMAAFVSERVNEVGSERICAEIVLNWLFYR